MTQLTIKLIFFLMAIFGSSAFAQNTETGFEQLKDDIMRHAILRENVDAEARLAEIETMKNGRFDDIEFIGLDSVIGILSFWTDGRVLVKLSPDSFKNPHQLLIRPYRNNVAPSRQFRLTAKTADVVSNDEGQTLQMACFGQWQMLVVKNRQGKVEEVYTRIDDSQANMVKPSFPSRDAHDIYDGHYRNGKNDDVFFGPNSLYGVKTYNHDPGLFISVPLANEPYADLIAYGGGRVSHGKSGTTGRGRGAGGRGALMGSMAWEVRPCLRGIDAKVVADEPTVSHDPAIRQTEVLIHEASPFGNDVPGQWAFASVRPVGRGLLARFPSETLRLMRNEIFARHGHRFNATPDIQRFFDSKTWYHPLDKPTALTPIETLNVQVILAEELGRKE